MDRETSDLERSGLRLELVATVLLACATVLTAWSAFQATKWSGVQANSYAAAGAARTESVRASDRANTLTAIDVDTFVAWVTAVAEERGDAQPSDAPYAPEPGTLSAFLFERFRDEFRPAMDAWLATRPLLSPDAPSSPFEMQDYRLAAAVEADALERESENQRDQAQRANQTGDNYVLLTVLFAAVLLFAGVSTNLDSRRGQLLMFVLGIVVFLGAAVTLVTFPVEI